MLPRSAKPDGNYFKIVTVFTTLVLAMSGLVLSPAHAIEVPSNGTYLCTSGEASDLTPNFTITNGAVTAGASCAGAVVIPEGVTRIGAEAFAFARFDSINIPASVTTIGDGAFYYATFTNITVDGANPNYSSADGVLFNKDSSTLIAYPAGKTGTSYAIPAGVTSIGHSAFEDARLLTSITIPANVATIGISAFENATALKTVTFESGSQLTSIGDYAFLNTYALGSIDIPASVTSIGEYAFAGATSLTSVYFLGNAPTSVGPNPFYVVADGAKAYIKSGATGFGDEASWNGLIVELDWTPTDGFYLCSAGVLTTTGTPTYRVLDGEVSSGASCAGAVVIPEGVTSIGDGAFAGATALTSITIPASVTTIGTFTFFNATALTTVTFESGSKLTSIGEYAFAFSTSLDSITIPASVISIGDSAFYYATSLTSVYFLGNAPTFVRIFTFMNVADGAKAYIKSGATGFGDEASWNGLIVEVVVTDGFYLCSTGVLTTTGTPTYRVLDGEVSSGASCAGAVVIPEGVTSIGDGAFAESSLDSITIPASLTTIGLEAFAGASALKTVTFESGSQLKSIGDSAFDFATALEGITIPATVTTIGDGAFAGATALTSITVDGANPNYSSAGGVLFNEDSSTLIAYPAGKTGNSYAIPATVTTIEERAFDSATALEGITIPASVTSIGNYAFNNATALTSVYFLGNAPTSVGTYPFMNVADGAKAYIKSGATDFGDEASWNGLVVTIGVYTVTYNTSGGSAVTAQNYFANFPTPTSPTRDGYTFAGWSATAGGSVIAWPHTPALGSDITLYAKWTSDLAKAVAKVKPSVSGTAKVSKSLAAKKGTWTGVPTPKITYQWYSCNKKVATVKAVVPNTCKKISRATKSTLKLAKAQKGKFIAVLVTGNSAGTSATKWLSKSTTKVS